SGMRQASLASGRRRAVSIGGAGSQGQIAGPGTRGRAAGCALHKSPARTTLQSAPKGADRHRDSIEGIASVASMGLNLDEQKAVERFRKDVVDPSRSKLVILDFWAEWCGPCKALTPVLEKVAADYADQGVLLAKVNVDEEQFIAAQFQVRSIPTVYAIFQGQPVADLTPMRSESQLKQALDQLLSQLPIEGGAGDGPGDIAPLLAMGEQVLADGDGERAAAIFTQIVEMAPENAAARSGLIRALLSAERGEEARAAFDSLPEALRADPLVAQAGAA